MNSGETAGATPVESPLVNACVAAAMSAPHKAKGQSRRGACTSDLQQVVATLCAYGGKHDGTAP